MRRKRKWQPKLIAAVLAVGLAASPVQSSLSQAYADSKAAEAVTEEKEKPERESGSKAEETEKDENKKDTSEKVESGEGKLDEENKDTGSDSGNQTDIEEKDQSGSDGDTEGTEEIEETEENKDESSDKVGDKEETGESREESSTEEETKEGSESGEAGESDKDTGENDETRESTEGSVESDSKADTEESTEAGSEDSKDETEETVEGSEEKNEAETKAEDEDLETNAALKQEIPANSDKLELEEQLEAGNGIFSGGDGSKKSPYLISSAENLKAFAESVNKGKTYQNKYISLDDDIDLNEEELKDTIGIKGKLFAGNFDGKNHTIFNLNINKPKEEYVGLFGSLGNGGSISNITIENAAVTGKAKVGTLVGAAAPGKIENVKIRGTITIKGNYQVGGLAGYGYANIKDCHVEASEGSTITGEYAEKDFEGDNVGGIIGFRGEGDLTIENVSVAGVQIAGSRKVGGITGTAYINNIYSDCSVSEVELICNAPYDYAKGALVKGQLAVGGLVGMFAKDGAGGKLENCSVSDLTFDVTDPQIKEADWPVLGLISGGYRPYSFSSSVKIPDEVVKIEDVTVGGENIGSNAEKKFPGSVAMNGSDALFAEGSGTQEDPYIIASVEDLKLLAAAVNKTGKTFEGQYLKIGDSVDELNLSEEVWESIGSSSNKFMGNFDGNGKTIRGLNDGGKSATTGLFGYISGATIRNLKLLEVEFTATGRNRAALAGTAYGSNKIENIRVTGNIIGSDYVGGILGRPYLNEGNLGTITILDCINEATIECSEKGGGIVGYARADVAGTTSFEIKDCENKGNITGQYVGGISGWSMNATLTNCKNRGNVSGKITAGGIVGTIQKITMIENAFNEGTITGEGDGKESSAIGAGGIAGNSGSGGNTVSKSSNIGTVTGIMKAGGIIGGSSAQGDMLDNCYNTGAVTATGEGAVAAGIYAYNMSSGGVKACLNNGAISAPKGTVYQIGESQRWYDPAPGDKNESCYYIDADGNIILSSKNGKDEGTVQEGMTLEELADLLNEVGGIGDFWKLQNGTVQPDFPEEEPEECPHDELSDYQYNANEHWMVCEICGKKVEIEPHSFSEGENVCEVCGYEKKDTDKDDSSEKPGSKGSSGSGSGSSSTIRNNGSWHQDNVGWWFAKIGGGYPADQWYECYWNGQMKWYHFNAQGYLDAGWFTDKDGATYYLHNLHDNHFGYMYTGWNWIDGKCYYFTPNTIAGGPKQGMLYKNGITPDGYSVNETGAWTVNGVAQTK